MLAGFADSDRLARVRGYVLTGLVLFLLTVLQTTVLSNWKLFGAVPDLVLCATVMLGFCRGREEGAVLGIVAGVLIAALGSYGITVAPVFYMAVGYVCGHFGRTVYPKRLLSYLFFLGVSLPFAAVKTVIQACLMQENPRPAMLFLYAVLPQAAGTLTCGAVLFLPLRLLLGKSGGKRKKGGY